MTDTTPAPERIWINPDRWIDRPPKPTDFRPEEYVQYIREDNLLDRIKELEAKLAKAVEALALYSCEDGCNECPESERDRVSCGWTACRTLAELKGETDA